MLDYSAGLPRSNAAKASPRLDRSICGHRSEKLYWTDARVLAPVVMLVAIARISIDPFSIERHHANFAHSFIVAQSFIITGPDIWQGCSKNLHQSEVLVLVHLLDKFSCLPIFSHNAITSSDQSVEDVRQEVKGSPVSNALAKLLPLVFWISNRIRARRLEICEPPFKANATAPFTTAPSGPEVWRHDNLGVIFSAPDDNLGEWIKRISSNPEAYSKLAEKCESFSEILDNIPALSSVAAPHGVLQTLSATASSRNP
eukprot:3877584-Rhodomonas_salina.2